VSGRRQTASNPNLDGTIQNKAASRAGRAANGRIKIGSKSSRDRKMSNKIANNPNRGGKAVGNEVGGAVEAAVVEAAINNAANKARSSVAVDVVAVASRTVIVGVSASAIRNAMIDQRQMWKK
jgi:hypothetical protein